MNETSNKAKLILTWFFLKNYVEKSVHMLYKMLKDTGFIW